MKHDIHCEKRGAGDWRCYCAHRAETYKADPALLDNRRLAERIADLERENAKLRDDLVAAQFWTEAANLTNADFEEQYLAIWKAVKQPDKTVLESVLALKEERDQLRAQVIRLSLPMDAAAQTGMHESESRGVEE